MLLNEDISDKELKQRWRLYWLQCIFEFSNIKLQRMSWVEGSKADWSNSEEWPSSFEECYSAYFDNLALDDAYEKAVQWGNVSQEEADKSKVFHQLAAFYDEPGVSSEDVLSDVEWMKVVEAAKEFWQYLKVTVTSEREIELMKKLEKDFC